MSQHASTLERAVALHRAGDIDKALGLYQQVARRAPGDARAHALLSQALAAQARYEAAVEAAQTAVRADPLSLELRQHLAFLFTTLARPDDALAVWRDAHAAAVRARNPAQAAQCRLALATLLSSVHRPQAALDELRAMADQHPDLPAVWFEHGRVAERMGLDDQARPALERALASGQRNLREPASILLTRLDIRSAADPAAARDQAIARLDALVPDAPDAFRPALLIEIAQLLDKQGRHAQAFSTAAQASAQQWAMLPAHLRDGRAHEAVIAGGMALTAEQVAAWPQLDAADRLPDAESPIFLVGFPRSGTTLVEQILAAHPRLAVTDEAPILQRVREQLYRDFMPTGMFPGDLGRFTPRQILKARRNYLDRAARLAHGFAPGKRIVDKQPLNTVDLALVRLLFPNAPVIAVRRDPRDTVLSCFLQSFTRGVPHLFSLDGAARFYALLAALHDHYDRVLRLRTHVLHYERLAAAPESQIRALLDFLGEPWHDAVLMFNEPAHRRYVSTPTYADVARPVHSRAVGRWTNYREQLAPILPVLQPWCDPAPTA